ncbi:NADH-quinone oxidoreductase subunit D, partial [Acidobacteriia bacterium AH_259_A11_L15]|nr:NADH-quinone oxidoreductase subunit D [Acidobacteriia bacterium AH_259_A11_L15]
TITDEVELKHEFERVCARGYSTDVEESTYLVRLEEMRQSVRIVEQCLDALPEGPITAKLPKMLKIPEGTEVYHVIESPRGELGYYMIADGSDKPYKCKIRAPSFVNLAAITQMVKGHLV